MTYSLDFRRKVLSVREEEGLTIAEVAIRFKIGVASVTRWIKNPEPQRSRNKPATKINMEALKQDIQDYPDAYMYERAQRLNVSKSGIEHALRRLNISYKKNTLSPQGRRRRTAYFPKEDR